MPPDVRRAIVRRAQIAVPALIVIIAVALWLLFGPVPAPIPPCPAAVACVID